MKKPRHFLRAEIASQGATALLSSDLVQRGFGEKIGEKWWLFPEEALFLLESGKIEVYSGDTLLDPKAFLEIMHDDSKFIQRYVVYKDLRSRGYLVRAGAKYGADFRVYEKDFSISKTPRSQRPHSRYLVLVVNDDAKFDVKLILGLNRVAHSVNKRLWLAVVDRDLGVTYVELKRVAP